MVEIRGGEKRALVRSDRVFRVDDDNDVRQSTEWLPKSVEVFRENVGDRAYPCHFGRYALELGELFGTAVARGQPVTRLADDLSAFLDATRPWPKRRMVLAAFFEPESVEH